MVCVHTENRNQGNLYSFTLLEVSVLHESPLGHLRYGLTDVPPQPNSLPEFVLVYREMERFFSFYVPDNVFDPDQSITDFNARNWTMKFSSVSSNR